MTGVYLHIPFCKRLCHYCDFYSATALGLKTEVLDVMRKELSYLADFVPDRTASTIYIGGGTPSLCSIHEIAGLLDAVHHTWDTSKVLEVTLEANPDDLDLIYLRELRTLGINRLSIGIQSFIDRDLKFMNRRHDAETAIRAVGLAQQAGFDNLSIDLIYGVPGMSTRDWAHNLEVALGLDVQHISAYHLSIEDGTFFGRMQREGRLKPVDERISEEQYALLHDRMAEAGFVHYEISNFARPGYQAVHNSNYWNGAHYVGAGPSAHSFNGTHRRWNLANNRAYLDGFADGRWFETEKLSEIDQYNEFIMTRLRTAAGFRAEELVARFGILKLRKFIRAAASLIEQGLLIREVVLGRESDWTEVGRKESLRSEGDTKYKSDIVRLSDDSSSGVCLRLSGDVRAIENVSGYETGNGGVEGCDELCAAVGDKDCRYRIGYEHFLVSDAIIAELFDAG